MIVTVQESTKHYILLVQEFTILPKTIYDYIAFILI